MIAMSRSQSVPAAESLRKAFPQKLSPTSLPQPIFRAGIEKILVESGTWQGSAGCAFAVLAWPREVLFVSVPTAAIAGASTTASPAAVPWTAGIQKLRHVPVVVGLSAIDAEHAVVMPVAV